MYSKTYSPISASENSRRLSPIRDPLRKCLVAGALLCIFASLSLGVNSPPPIQNPKSKIRIPSSLPADSLSIFKTIPADAVVAYAGFGNATVDAGTGQMITSLLATASMTGLLNANQQILADIVSGIVAVGKFPHAVFLLDVRAKKLAPGSFTLDGLSLGVTVEAPEKDQPELLALLKRTLDHYFTAENAKIAWIGEGPARRQKLDAKSFPHWCCWEWGSVGNTFIFAVGPGAYDRILDTLRPKTAKTEAESLHTNVLIELSKTHDADLDRRFVMVYLNVSALTDGLRPVMEDTYDQVLASFSATRLDQFLYSAGFTKRAYISKVYTTHTDDDKAMVGLLTGDFAPGDPRARAVPPPATTYGIGYTDISKAIGYIVDTYLASRNATYHAKLTRNYARLAREAGLGDVHEILFSHFGNQAMVIVHDWPRHPLGLPYAKTLLIQHDHTPGFKDTWNKVLGTWQMMIRSMARPENDPRKSDNKTSAWETLFDLQLDRTADDVWFLHVGPLVLLAAGMDDNFLVLSYSIPAVQANLQYLKATFPAASRPATRPAPAP